MAKVVWACEFSRPIRSSSSPQFAWYLWPQIQCTRNICQVDRLSKSHQRYPCARIINENRFKTCEKCTRLGSLTLPTMIGTANTVALLPVPFSWKSDSLALAPDSVCTVYTGHWPICADNMCTRNQWWMC